MAKVNKEYEGMTVKELEKEREKLDTERETVRTNLKKLNEILSEKLRKGV